MSDINTYTCSGRLTGDPEMRYTQSNKAVTSFTIAINGIKDEDTVFMRCTAWERKAEICNEFLSKGSRIMVTGRLKENKWETAEGDKRKSVEMNILDLVLPPKSEGGGQGANGQQRPPQGQQQGRPQQPQRSPQQGRPQQGQRPPQGQQRAQGQPQRGQQPDGWGKDDSADNGWGEDLNPDDIAF